MVKQIETAGVLSLYQILTLYFSGVRSRSRLQHCNTCHSGICESFDTGFAVASVVIVVHALGGLLAALPTGFLSIS
jgi:hypothetical protein